MPERPLIVWSRCRSSAKELSKLGGAKQRRRLLTFLRHLFQQLWHMVAETGGVIKCYFVHKTVSSLGIYYKAPVSILRGTRTVQVRSRDELGREAGHQAGLSYIRDLQDCGLDFVLCCSLEFVLNPIKDKQITLRIRGFMGAEGQDDIFTK